MPWLNTRGPSALEKVVSGLCYLTFGLAGILYIIISGQRNQSDFFRFHFLQSIVVGIIGMILSWSSGVLAGVLTSLIAMIPGSGGAQMIYWLSQAIGILLKAFNLLLVYGMIWAFLGKIADIPFLSSVVRRQMR